MGTISFNPMKTTGFSNSFVLTTKGYIQGTFLDDPAVRNQLDGGHVSSSQTDPLYGGLPVELILSSTAGDTELGPNVLLAGALSEIDAWTVFNQASAGIITPSSNVPLYSSGMSVNFMRPGSLARIAVPIVSTAQLSDMLGMEEDASVYWDHTLLGLTTSASGTYGPLPVRVLALDAGSTTVLWDGTAKTANWQYSKPCAIIQI